MAFDASALPAALAIALAGLLAGCIAEGQSSGHDLCWNGRPVARRADVAYGGLPPRHGYVRDHIVPLCLGGPDSKSNVQYQRHSAAHAKDKLEWFACGEYCAGHMTLERARSLFTKS